jgi:hypothetical protein
LIFHRYAGEGRGEMEKLKRPKIKDRIFPGKRKARMEE